MKSSPLAFKISKFTRLRAVSLRQHGSCYSGHFNKPVCEDGDGLIGCRTLLLSTLVSAMSRLHAGVGQVLQANEAESWRQAWDYLYQLRSRRRWMEVILRRNALAGTSILRQRQKGNIPSYRDTSFLGHIVDVHRSLIIRCLVFVCSLTCVGAEYLGNGWKGSVPMDHS